MESNKTSPAFSSPSLPLPGGMERVGVRNGLSLGIIGAGDFASFAANAFIDVEGVSIHAVSDVNNSVARSFAAEYDAKTYDNYNDLLKDEFIDLIYIATPPHLHFEQSKMALLSGKHVICEKPAALQTSQAEELQNLARSKQLLYVVNLMQRYNPLYTSVKTIIEEKILGNFLHGFFENYASDENLDSDHWFWDEEKSGGIFIEHGVHFFDMFSGWLGKGKVVNALQLQRPGQKKKLIDRVQATVLYDDSFVNFYHGFDQPKVLDRQEMRLHFERGDITLYEWVPVKMRLYGLLQNGQLQALHHIMDDTTLLRHAEASSNKRAKGRFTDILYDEQVTFESGNTADKQSRYSLMLKAMLQDQLSWINNQDHVRIINDNNAVESLRMAEEASHIAQTFNEIH